MKVIILSVIIYFFSLVAYGMAAERDCSNPKKLHEKLICKMKGSSNSNESNLNQDEKLSKKKSTLGKIKEVITQDSLVDAIKKAKE